MIAAIEGQGLALDGDAPPFLAKSSQTPVSRAVDSRVYTPTGSNKPTGAGSVQKIENTSRTTTATTTRTTRTTTMTATTT